MTEKRINIDRRRQFALIVLTALLSVISPHTAAAQQTLPTLHWELVNSFRFIHDPDSIDELKNAYDSLSPDQRSAYNLERTLQRISEAETARTREAARKRIDCAGRLSKTEKKLCFAPDLGWFAGLAQNNYQKTCWDAKKGKFRSEGECKNYIYPESHRVRVWLSDLSLLMGRAPEWFVNNQPRNDLTKCDDKYKRGICVEFDIKYDDNERETSVVSIKIPERGEMISTEPITIKDKLIVGLGDSYAAGEGNPDIPAQFTDARTDTDVLYDFKIRKAPQKDRDSEVAWLDRKCHRSMYSYQFKTALQLALSNRREAITYVSYSCSGGTTDNILNKKQRPNEGYGKVAVQLESLRKVLDNKGKSPRKIDYLLLSTGGNDIGFGKFVAYIITTGWARDVLTYGISEKSLKEKSEGIKEKLLSRTDPAKGNYRLLHKTLLSTPQQIAIKDCRSGKPCERILLTPYPDIFHAEDRSMCQVNRSEFDTPFKRDPRRAERAGWVKQYVFEPLRSIQTDPMIKSELGWAIIEGHFDAYLKHGFCAQDSKALPSSRESFAMPTKANDIWSSFDPQTYKAYEARQRWVRLPVDAKLTTDQALKIWRFSFDRFFEDDRSNIMHPTAEGLSVNADANVERIRELENTFGMRFGSN